MHPAYLPDPEEDRTDLLRLLLAARYANRKGELFNKHLAATFTWFMKHEACYSYLSACIGLEPGSEQLASVPDSWKTLEKALGELELEELAPDLHQHVLHLRGLLALRAGKIAKAAKLFEDGLGKEGSCELGPLLELTKALRKKKLRDADWTPDRPAVWQLVGALRAADQALAAKDFETARAALDRLVVWRAGEYQSLARLAAAWLGLEPQTPSAVWRKRRALAAFCEVHRQVKEPMMDTRRVDLEIPGVAWKKSRLDKTARAAAAWLEAGHD